MPKSIVNTDHAPAAIGTYSQAVLDESTGLLFCSGQIGLDPSSGQMVSGGTAVEMEQIFENVSALLKAAECTFGDVVRTTLYLIDMADFAVANEVYARFIPEPYPARSTVQAAALPKGARAEMEVTAVLPAP